MEWQATSSETSSAKQPSTEQAPSPKKELLASTTFSGPSPTLSAPVLRGYRAIRPAAPAQSPRSSRPPPPGPLSPLHAKRSCPADDSEFDEARDGLYELADAASDGAVSTSVLAEHLFAVIRSAEAALAALGFEEDLSEADALDAVDLDATESA